MAIYINPKKINSYNVLYTSGGNSMYGQYFELPIDVNLSAGDKLEWKCAVWRNNYVTDWVELQNIESTGNLPYMGSYKVHTLEFNNGNGYRRLTNKFFYTNYITANSARLFIFDFEGDYSGRITKFTNEYNNDRSVSCAYQYINVIDSNDNIKENWIPAELNNQIGMYDTVSKRFIAMKSDSYTQGLATLGDKISEIEYGKVKYFAIKNNDSLIFPKKVYFANSNNTLKLVYERPTYDIHIINLDINSKLGNANKVSEIKFTNNLLLQKKAYDNNIVDITFQNHFKTVEFLVQNADNDTFTCYIANAFWGENSKVYCYGDFSRCFMYCSILTTIPVSNFETSNVTSMYAMFAGCKELKSLDVSNFDTSRCENMQFMFIGLYLIKRLDISNFNLSSVTLLSSFIRNCYKLEYLKLPILNTLNAIDCSYMFNYNPKLISLNLNSFSTNNCKNIVYLIDDNYSLRRIFANTLDTSSLENYTLDDGVVVPGDYNVFRYNIALKGGNGTTYDANHIDSEYARIDGENGLAGYFTDPADAIKITLINIDNEGYTDEIYLCAGDTYTIPALDGYTAVVTDNNGNTYNDGNNITINQDITLTFVWSANNNE